VQEELGPEARELDTRPFVRIGRVHGHVGPFVALGYQAGRFAQETLGVSSFHLKAEVFAGRSPPASCFADGVQLGSGCTLGKGNINLHGEELIEVDFHADDGRSLRMRVASEVLARVRTGEEDLVELSEEIMGMPVEQVFTID
jgi:formylmethanofuran dehydrogenase subunit E